MAKSIAFNDFARKDSSYTSVNAENSFSICSEVIYTPPQMLTDMPEKSAGYDVEQRLRIAQRS